jgi:hypothetical protein
MGVKWLRGKMRKEFGEGKVMETSSDSVKAGKNFAFLR